MTTMHIFDYLVNHPELYREKRVLDMGCGAGILGLTMAQFDASQTDLSDIDYKAEVNTVKNIERFGLGDKCNTYQSDLFESIPENRYGLIIFNHPFFTGKTIENIPISRTMLTEERQIHDFLEQAKEYQKKDAIVVMPYFHLAGQWKDPAVQGPKHGYDVTEVYRTKVGKGLQQGDFSVYHLNLK